MNATRLKVWGGLGVGLAVAVGLLVWATGQGDDEAPAGSPRFVRVVDIQGQPVHHARVLVLTEVGAPQGSSGSWSSDTATLTLPPGLGAVAVTVAARGYRSTRLESLAGEDTTLTLKRGVLVRMRAGGAGTDVPPPFELVFHVAPASTVEGGLDAEQRGSAIELMDTWSPLPEGVETLSRGPLGLALRASEAADGILVPYPGRYEVRWGLLDPATRTWFALDDVKATAVGVEDDERAQVFELAIARGELERTRKGLEEMLARIAAGETTISEE